MNFKERVVKSLQTILQDKLDGQTIEKLIERPKYSHLGDYAFPAFSLAKIEKRAPQQIALDLAKELQGDDFAKVEAVGPYVNFFIKHDELTSAVVSTILSKGNQYASQSESKGNVTIDMSSPNIAKPMSMGHLRSTVIGNSISLILDKVGFDPIKINHLGDWGTQFGKLIVAYKKWGSEDEVRQDPINNLLKYYVEFHEEAEKHPELDDEARLWFKKLEDNDEEALKLWRWFREESLKEFQRVYDILGVTFDSYNGEAFYNDKMDAIVEELKEKDLLQESQGAQIVDLDDLDLSPALIQKSDGATLYMTRDLAAAIYRKNTYNFAESLYVVGNEQSEHFKQLKAVLGKMGYDWSDDIRHIPFGLITSGGKKLSTRKGNIILLEEVLSDAVRLAKAQIDEKNPNLPNKEQVAHEVGVGAVIFHDLRNDRLDNFDFNLEEVVRFEGDTGPYVQYTNARAQSILRKANHTVDATPSQLELTDDYSFEVAKELLKFNEVVQRAAEKYEPSIIAKYAINLAQLFNKYYANQRILDEDKHLNARLALVEATSVVLTESLRLLGVNAPKEM